MNRPTGNKTILGRRFICGQSVLNAAFGTQTLAVACEVKVRHEHADDACRKGRLPLLLNRHVDRERKLPCGVFVGRDTPGEEVRRDAAYLSLAIQPPLAGGTPVGGELYRADLGGTCHQAEWDFLREQAGMALARAGVGEAASVSDKVRALADYAATFEGPEIYPSYHPVDVLLHTSYCSGMANLFFALANVMGVTCRSINIFNHSVIEVLIEGSWHYVDNHLHGGGFGRFVEGRDYLDVTLRVDECGFTFKDQIDYLTPPGAWHRSPYHYSSMLQWHWAWGESRPGQRGGRSDIPDGYGVSVPCDPCHAAALYPRREVVPFPLWAGVPELTLTEKAAWLRADLFLPPGEALLKTVWFGPSDDNPLVAGRVEWWFAGEVAKEDVIMQWDGGGAPATPTRVEPGSGGVSKVVFELKEDAMWPGRRHFVLDNVSRRPLRAVVYPTPLLDPDPVCTGSVTLDLPSLRVEPL